ncbi:MAG: hypothetical protein ACI9JN_001076 [Bacteroidia bacterium]|jgi:hypothetical protein
MKLGQKLESSCAYIDLTRIPLVVQTVKNINPSIVQVQAHLDLFNLMLRNTSGPLYIISDMKVMKWANLKATIYLGKGMFQLDKTHSGRIQLHCFMSAGPLLRLLIPLFTIFAKLEGKQVCRNTMDEAVDWISLETGLPFY